MWRTTYSENHVSYFCKLILDTLCVFSCRERELVGKVTWLGIISSDLGKCWHSPLTYILGLLVYIICANCQFLIKEMSMAHYYSCKLFMNIQDNWQYYLYFIRIIESYAGENISITSYCKWMDIYDKFLKCLWAVSMYVADRANL